MSDPMSGLKRYLVTTAAAITVALVVQTVVLARWTGKMENWAINLDRRVTRMENVVFVPATHATTTTEAMTSP